MSRSTKPVQMAWIRIGYEEFLLPAEKAMKVLELMSSAFRCSRDYGGGSGFTYEPGEQPSVELALVRPDQVRMPGGTAPSATGMRALK